MNESSFSPEDFSGQVRLFPIPDLVMFPHVMQPLHVFEPRYQDLLAEALAQDQLITMPVIRPEESGDKPALEPIACLGQVVSHQPLPGGPSNVLILGIARVRLTFELPKLKAFREAAAEFVAEIDAAETTSRELSMRLVQEFKLRLCKAGKDPQSLDALLDHDMSLTVLTDIMAHTLPLCLTTKAALLAENAAEARARRLLDALASDAKPDAKVHAVGRRYPATFSQN